MRNRLSSAVVEIAVELAITAAMSALALLFHEINLAIRAIVGPQFTPIVWVALMLITLVGVATCLIRSGNNRAVTAGSGKQTSGQMTY
jgi:hypothetical protein